MIFKRGEGEEIGRGKREKERESDLRSPNDPNLRFFIIFCYQKRTIFSMNELNNGNISVVIGSFILGVLLLLVTFISIYILWLLKMNYYYIRF